MVTFRARIARTGAQSYPGGLQWRDPNEVFDSASLATLANLKVQIGHADSAPSVGRVVPDSYGRECGPDGNEYLTAVLEITDASTIALIRGGRSSGISMGYQCGLSVRDGRTHQTTIRFDHCAILRRDVETPRCGAGCSIKDRQDMRLTSDSIQLDGSAVAACGCSAAEQAERDRIDAYLDHFADKHGVARSAIVAEMARVHDAATTHVTKELIKDAAERISRPGSFGAAQFYNARRDGARALDSDDAFRAHLAAQLDADVALATDPDAPQKIIAAGHAESKRLEREHGAAMAAAGLDNDDAFRAALAKRSHGA